MSPIWTVVASFLKDKFSKDKFIRNFVYLALIALGLISLWQFIEFELDGAHGKHVKFLWLEKNIPKYDSPPYVKHDTPSSTISQTLPSVKQNVQKQIGPTITQKNIKGKNEANNNNGTNNGNIGGTYNTTSPNQNIVNGTNNGWVGNVSMTSSKHFEEIDRIKVQNLIDSLKSAGTVPMDTIFMVYWGTSNLQVFGREMRQYLESRGYHVEVGQEIGDVKTDYEMLWEIYQGKLKFTILSAR